MPRKPKSRKQPKPFALSMFRKKLPDFFDFDMLQLLNLSDGQKPGKMPGFFLT